VYCGHSNDLSCYKKKRQGITQLAVLYGIIDQHYALIIIPLFTQATNIYSTGVHPNDTTISDFQVTHKDKGRSLKMAHKCRNM
jgi:hypothetical protein